MTSAATPDGLTGHRANWDYSIPIEQDQQQWDGLVLQWLALDPRGRHPYHLQSSQIGLAAYASQSPSQEQVDRVLRPHQTVQERNSALMLGRMSPVWLRTCYTTELEDQYQSMVPSWHDNIVEPCNMFDDEALYGALANDWRAIFLRAPSIPDVKQILGDPEFEGAEIPDDEWGEPEEGYQAGAFEASKREKTLLYLLDEEAVREGVAKLLWLDGHGNCVWENKVEDLWYFQGPLKRGLFLYEIVGNYAFDVETWERGALLKYS